MTFGVSAPRDPAPTLSLQQWEWEPVTLRIERIGAQGRTVVRLIGRVESACLAEIEAQVEGAEPGLALDLEEVTLVDREAVRFFIVCEHRGIELLRCAPYIRYWMASEGEQ